MNAAHIVFVVLSRILLVMADVNLCRLICDWIKAASWTACCDRIFYNHHYDCPRSDLILQDPDASGPDTCSIYIVLFSGGEIIVKIDNNSVEFYMPQGHSYHYKSLRLSAADPAFLENFDAAIRPYVDKLLDIK